MDPNDVLSLLMDGQSVPLDEAIGSQSAALVREYISSGMVTEEDLSILANVVRKLKAEKTLEIGLASASTAITIMASKVGGGHHTAFDPCQTKEYHNLGMKRIEQAGLTSSITLIEEPSYIGLPSLIAEGRGSFDFVYIDANHMFDHTLLEWFYADKLLKVGGVVGFDDVIWPMVHAVVNFVESNCDYSFWKPNDRTWLGVKLSDDTRHWFSYKPFIVPWGNHYQGMIDGVRKASGY